MENLGFLINYTKSELESTQSITILSFLINSVSMQIRLPKDKVSHKIRLPKDKVSHMVQETQNLL